MRPPDELNRYQRKKVVETPVDDKFGPTRPARGYRLYLYHPQWGGYVAEAAVDFAAFTGDCDGGPGCFELSVCHNGDFPTEDVRFERHCCSALQFVRFGLDVYEAQVQHQKRDARYSRDTDGRLKISNAPEPTPAPVFIDEERLAEFRDRINVLLAQAR